MNAKDRAALLKYSAEDDENQQEDDESEDEDEDESEVLEGDPESAPPCGLTVVLPLLLLHTAF